MTFIPGLELSQMLYEEEIKPILEKEFACLGYAAATMGMCSEVLGLDDEVSMDHEWGPRITIFLSEQDQKRYANSVMNHLQKNLPARFKGYPMMWRKPGVSIHNTRETALYHVWISTVNDALGFCGGLSAIPLIDLDWLRISEQHLLEFSSGIVYKDDIGDLTRARQALAYYPDHVLRFLLMSEWNAVGGDWFPIGRLGSKGDALGLKIQSARIARSFMRIAYRVNRTYFPYKKWFGLLFKQLPIAAELEPKLMELLEENRWQQVEEKMGEIAQFLIEQQNLGIAPKISFKMKKATDGRHYMDYDFWQIGRQLTRNLQTPLKTIMDNEVFFMDDRSLILWNDEVAKWPLLLQK